MRVNVVSKTADRELDAVRARISGFASATCLDDVIAMLRARAAVGETIDTIDLIGHSRDGVLVLGATLLDDSPPIAIEIGEQLRPLVAVLGVRAIRLLGCSTATTEHGRSALRRISLAARCDVLGTRRYISQHDYGPNGFIADGALVGARALAAFIRSRSGIPARGC